VTFVELGYEVFFAVYRLQYHKKRECREVFSTKWAILGYGITFAYQCFAKCQ
jgi:hypothetical protein